MAQGIYKSGEIIHLTYQAIGGLSNAIPVSKVYDEGNASDVAKQTVLNSALLAGEKAGGRYLGYFTPDAEGAWTICIQDKNGDGLVSKTYEVSGYNVDALGDAQVAMESGLKSAALIDRSAVISSAKSDALVKQSAIISSVKSAQLVMQSAINTAIASDLLLTQSAINAATASDLLLLQSTVATKLAAETSDVKSALLVSQSAVVSSILVELVAASSPAMVS